MEILVASDVSPEAIEAGRGAADNADMIVAGAQPRRRLVRNIEGSVARDIVRRSDVPLVCVAR